MTYKIRGKAKLLAIFILVASGCGSSKKEEQKRLDDNTITVSPAAGTYEHGVVVVFTKKDTSAGSGALQIQKADGTWEFALGSCAGGVSGSNCFKVNESQTVNYRLTTTAGEGSSNSLVYKIQPIQKDLTLNGQAYSEAQSDCSVSDSNGVKSLKGRIKLSNSTTLGADKLVYAFFEVNDVSKLNEELIVTNSINSGVQVTSSGDSIPFIAGTFSPGSNSASTSDNCKVKLTGYTAGQKATGTFECSLTQSQFQEETALTKTLVIGKSEWQCDRWLDSLVY